MKKTFLFYDLETSGLRKAFDQVLQYAALRVDENLEIVEEIEYKVRLNPDTIPSPEAIATHGIGVDDFNDQMHESMAMCHIHQIHNQPGTISGGYNTLGFDDEFLRFSFYRNLLNPYSHQFSNGCGRFDIYPMMPFYYLYAKDAIKWPMINGKVSLKLDNINQENNWLKGRAHDAMHDVRVTLKLAQEMRDFDREKWAYAMGYFDKATDLDRIVQLPSVKTFGADVLKGGLLISGLFAKDRFVKPALYLGAHHHFKNQGLWLILDEPLSEGSNWHKLIMKKKLAEAPFVLPLGERFDSLLSEEQIDNMESNFKWIDRNLLFLQSMARQQKDRTLPPLDDCDPDARIYQDGFRTRDDYQWADEFYQSMITHKLDMIDSAPSDIMATQAARIIYRNYPNNVNAAVRKVAKMDQKGCDHLGQYPLSVKEAITRTSKVLETDLSPETRHKVAELMSLLKEREHGKTD